MHPADGVAFAVDMTDETVPVGQFLQASRSDGTAYGTMSQLPGAGYRDAGGGAMRLGVLSNGFWSSTAVGASQSSRLIFNFGSMTPDDHLAMNDNAMPIRCVPTQSTDVPAKQGSGVEILFLDNNDTLQIGYWDTPANSAAGSLGTPITSLDQLVYFKFGSIVGMSVTPPYGVPFNLNQIVFSPRTHYAGQEITRYASATGDASSNVLPAVPGYDFGEDQSYADITQDLPDSYHRPHLGKGDPCRMAGLSIATARAMSDEHLASYDSGWRTATVAQTITFIGTGDNFAPTGVWGDHNVITTADNLGRAIFSNSRSVELPACGFIDAGGKSDMVTFMGIYWTRSIAGDLAGNMDFSAARLVISNYSRSDGFAVRCVPK